MAYYKISDTSLTAIGDAIREHTGKHTREEMIPVTDNEFYFEIDSKNPVDAEKFYPSPNDPNKVRDYEFTYSFRNAYKYLVVYDNQTQQPEGATSILTTYATISLCDTIHGYSNTEQIKLGYTNNGSGELITAHENSYDGLKFFFRYRLDAPNHHLKVSFTIYALDEYGEIINEEQVTVKDTMTPGEMAQEISEFILMPNEAFNITGNCQYKFAQGGWDWLVNKFGDKITTTDITVIDNMFSYTDLTRIPFDINISNSLTSISCANMFSGAHYLVEIPKINNATPNDMKYMFYSCENIRYLPEDIVDWFDWSNYDNYTSAYNGNQQYIFNGCKSLRAVPLTMFNHINQYVTYSYVYWYYGFAECYTLDELIGLPIPKNSSWTSNSFNTSFYYCSRLKELTFEVQDDGTPYTMNWKKQTIDLSSYVGYVNGTYRGYILNYNSGITADKEVTDNASYQALKDDPDWWTSDIAYSRYNHTSAVNTINSLPDISAAGGSNTIKFKGAAGSATDGGAINTLTEEEIAVATAKGWTVSFA